MILWTVSQCILLFSIRRINPVAIASVTDILFWCKRLNQLSLVIGRKLNPADVLWENVVSASLNAIASKPAILISLSLYDSVLTVQFRDQLIQNHQVTACFQKRISKIIYRITNWHRSCIKVMCIISCWFSIIKIVTKIQYIWNICTHTFQILVWKESLLCKSNKKYSCDDESKRINGIKV